MTTKRPTFIADSHLEYLDDLRDSGATNMFGAARYLESAFYDLPRRKAEAILSYWMATFSERHKEAS